jgi:hypothetical protein
MASSEDRAQMNFGVARPVKELAEEYGRQRGISMAAAVAVLIVKGAKAEGLDTSAVDGTPAPARTA